MQPVLAHLITDAQCDRVRRRADCHVDGWQAVAAVCVHNSPHGVLKQLKQHVVQVCGYIWHLYNLAAAAADQYIRRRSKGLCTYLRNGGGYMSSPSALLGKKVQSFAVVFHVVFHMIDMLYHAH